MIGNRSGNDLGPFDSLWWTPIFWDRFGFFSMVVICCTQLHQILPEIAGMMLINGICIIFVNFRFYVIVISGILGIITSLLFNYIKYS